MSDILPVSLQDILYSRESKLRKQIVVENGIIIDYRKEGAVCNSPFFCAAERQYRDERSYKSGTSVQKQWI